MKITFAEGKYSVQLTRRDLEIFRLIQSEGAKTSADLAERFWSDKSKKAHAGFQRIRILIQSGFLERGNPKFLYLSESAKKLLLEQSSVEGVKANALLSK